MILAIRNPDRIPTKVSGFGPACAITLVAVFLLSGCAVTPHKHALRARITFYNAHEDKYGSRIAAGGRAVEGRTVAAAKVIPFGTCVEIPKLAGIVGDGKFVVEDRGRDVERAKAGHGLPVIDVFVASRRQYRRCRDYCDPVMEIVMP
jgi:3D (Asp-Asp-Asp) domain-containing protein